MLGLIENGSTHAIVSYIWNNNSIFLEPTYHSKGSALLLFSLYTIVYIKIHIYTNILPCKNLK